MGPRYGVHWATVPGSSIKHPCRDMVVQIQGCLPGTLEKRCECKWTDTGVSQDYGDWVKETLGDLMVWLQCVAAYTGAGDPESSTTTSRRFSFAVPGTRKLLVSLEIMANSATLMVNDDRLSVTLTQIWKGHGGYKTCISNDSYTFDTHHPRAEGRRLRGVTADQFMFLVRAIVLNESNVGDILLCDEKVFRKLYRNDLDRRIGEYRKRVAGK